MGGGLSRSSVASFLLLGGGGGKTPKCTDRRKKNVYVTYMRERASASDIYVFSGLKIHLHVYIIIHPIQWYGIINDSMTDKH